MAGRIKFLFDAPKIRVLLFDQSLYARWIVPAVLHEDGYKTQSFDPSELNLHRLGPLLAEPHELGSVVAVVNVSSPYASEGFDMNHDLSIAKMLSARMPVIITTAEAQEVLERYRIPYFPKPYSVDELSNRILSSFEAPALNELAEKKRQMELALSRINFGDTTDYDELLSRPTAWKSRRIATKQSDLFIYINDVVNERGGVLKKNGKRESGLHHTGALLDAAASAQEAITRRIEHAKKIIDCGEGLNHSDLDNIRERILGKCEAAPDRFDLKQVNKILTDALLIARYGNQVDLKTTFEEQFDLFVAVQLLVEAEGGHDAQTNTPEGANIRKAIAGIAKRMGNLTERHFELVAGHTHRRCAGEPQRFDMKKANQMIDEAIYIASEGKYGVDPTSDEPAIDRISRKRGWSSRKYSLD